MKLSKPPTAPAISTLLSLKDIVLAFSSRILHQATQDLHNIKKSSDLSPFPYCLPNHQF